MIPYGIVTNGDTFSVKFRYSCINHCWVIQGEKNSRHVCESIMKTSLVFTVIKPGDAVNKHIYVYMHIYVYIYILGNFSIK